MRNLMLTAATLVAMTLTACGEQDPNKDGTDPDTCKVENCDNNGFWSITPQFEGESYACSTFQNTELDGSGNFTEVGLTGNLTEYTETDTTMIAVGDPNEEPTSDGVPTHRDPILDMRITCPPQRHDLILGETSNLECDANVVFQATVSDQNPCQIATYVWDDNGQDFKGELYSLTEVSGVIDATSDGVLHGTPVEDWTYGDEIFTVGSTLDYLDTNDQGIQLMHSELTTAGMSITTYIQDYGVTVFTCSFSDFN